MTSVNHNFRSERGEITGGGDDEWAGLDCSDIKPERKMAALLSTAALPRCFANPQERRFLRTIGESVAVAIVERELRSLWETLQNCDPSPIERVFLASLWFAAREGAVLGPVDHILTGADLSRRTFAPDDFATYLSIWPQRQIGPHRVDFYLSLSHGLFQDPFAETFGDAVDREDHPEADRYPPPQWDRLTAGLIVECDGQAYHAMTPDQAARDNQRDKDLRQAGYEVLRFRGTSIHHWPITVAVRALQRLQDVTYGRPAVDAGAG